MLLRNDRYNRDNAVASAIALTLINSYVGIFAVKLGADNLQLGYLSSWPNIVSVVGVLGAAAAVARAQKKQQVIAWIHMVGRAAALGAAAVPWFPERSRVWALILFWVMGNLPGSVGTTILQAFLADVFPGSERTRALASRQSWSTGASMVAVLASGWALDHWLPYPLGYQAMFVASFLFALLEVYYLMQLKEPVDADQEPSDRKGALGSGFAGYLSTLRHGPFARFLTASVIFHFTWQMAWPIFTRYQISELHADNTAISLITVANSISMIVSYPLWARYADRFGNHRVMPFAALWLATAPWLTALTPTVGWLIVVNVFTGASVSGVTLLVLNNLLDVAPGVDRPVYLAVHGSLVNTSAAIAPIVGAYLMDTFPIRQGLYFSTGFRVLAAGGFFLLNYLAVRQKGERPVMENESAVHSES